MSIKPIIEQIKNLMQTKGTPNTHPSNGLEAIVVKEQNINGIYSAVVAVGTTGGFGGARYFEIRGFVFEDTQNSFTESTYRIEPSVIARTKGVSYFCVIMKPGFIRQIDEAKWANAFTNLEDLLKVLQK